MNSSTRRQFLQYAVGSTAAVILSPYLDRLSAAAPRGRVSDAEAAARRVLEMARRSVYFGSRGVGGLIMDNRTGRVIAEGRNTRYRRVNASVASIADEVLTWDYTAHGETGLTKWYFANRRRLRLPPPAGLTIVTTLDPCAMCTGSILTAGFSVATVALDPTGGMNLGGDNAYVTLPAGLRAEAQGRSGLYAIDGQRAYVGPAGIPLRQTSVSGATGDACSSIFFNAPSRDLNPWDDIPVSRLVDPRSLPARSPALRAMRRAWPHAFALRLANPREPTPELHRFLTRLSRQTPGSRNAVAFIDPFGNLLAASADTPTVSPIATAFMNTTESYARTRYALFNDPDTHQGARRSLTEPSHGIFVWLHAPSPGLATTIKDLGAYGSSVGGRTPGSFQHFELPREGSITQLRDQISHLPPYYTQKVDIQPVQVGTRSAMAAAHDTRDDERTPYPAYP
ncbi:MAG: nucleoside deaminase [Actinobacteria bacterium]|nr:nucleoside deaminase [Actinomycetota bacterium]MBM3697319.1 nucleoside deaminase [Actinomycetota bacterium]